jgi:predicted ATPase
MRELPSGTVTFLFTDIEGSTKLLHELGDAYADALAEHRRALRAAFEAHGGVEVDTQGDAFFVAFARAGDALACAREGQEALSGPIRVRMGVHTGEPILTEEGYVGIDVHRAARIAGVGHGGQVLVSQSTRELAGAGGLHDLGEHRLKDLTAPERIWQLGDAEFPPLRSLNQSNLPQQPTPFVGREKELGEVLRLLADPKVRLLTLTGPGGSGKTRLAVQAAAEVVDNHEHGVWWVGLQAVRDAEVVLPTIASTLGAEADLTAHIGDRRMLIVLDNLEQVLDAAPQLGDLLGSCRNLRLIVTSRELLRLAAEREYAVPPFVEQEGVGFFLARARAVRADFEPDEHVLEICRRLDQLPLALELAAARVRALSPAQILDRLDRRLPLLTGGARDLPERQRTLRSAIAWSHELLEAGEQELFRRLAVFSGGCALEAAEEVAGADLDALQSLVEKSLVRFDGERYSLLETIREFGLEQLAESDEEAEIRRRHADFFLALGRQAGLAAEAGYSRRYELVPPDADNFRAAIDWALETGEIELAAEIAVSLENFWVTNDPFEGARRFEALLARGEELEPVLRARLLRCFSGSSHMAGRYEASFRAIQQSMALFREAEDVEGIAVVAHRLGIASLMRGELDEARKQLAEALELSEELESRRGIAESIGALGYLAELEGDLAGALPLFEESARIAAEVGFAWWRAGMLGALAETQLRLGRVEDGEVNARTALAIASELDDRQHMVGEIAALAWAAAERGDRARAGRLWGALETEVERAPLGQWENEHSAYEHRILAVDGPEFANAREEGRRVPFARVVDEALAG